MAERTHQGEPTQPHEVSPLPAEVSVEQHISAQQQVINAARATIQTAEAKIRAVEAAAYEEVQELVGDAYTWAEQHDWGNPDDRPADHFELTAPNGDSLRGVIIGRNIYNRITPRMLTVRVYRNGQVPHSIEQANWVQTVEFHLPNDPYVEREEWSNVGIEVHSPNGGENMVEADSRKPGRVKFAKQLSQGGYPITAAKEVLGLLQTAHFVGREISGAKRQDDRVAELT